jgi:hypothetical protein
MGTSLPLALSVEFLCYFHQRFCLAKHDLLPPANENGEKHMDKELKESLTVLK